MPWRSGVVRLIGCLCYRQLAGSSPMHVIKLLEDHRGGPRPSPCFLRSNHGGLCLKDPWPAILLLANILNSPVLHTTLQIQQKKNRIKLQEEWDLNSDLCIVSLTIRPLHHDSHALGLGFLVVLK